MHRNSFFVLLAATVVVTGLAIATVLHQPALRSADVSGEALFPGLTNKLASLKSVVVKQADGDLTFDWDGKGWVVRDRKNYPAEDAKVAEVVLGIARMTKLEAKTAMAEKLDRLDLNDPKAKNSRAKEVLLVDKDGKALADVIVGKRKFSLGKEGGTYVRLPPNPQSWLALGDINVGAKPRDWLKRDIADIKDRDVKRITVVHPDGERVIAGRQAPTDPGFKYENLPAGKQAASDYSADEFARMLQIFMLDDVARADDIPFPKEKTTTADFDGFAGWRVTVQLTQKDGNSWIKVKADPPPGGPKPDEPKPAPGTATVADWGKVIADLNARTNGWAFQVPTYSVAIMNKRMADLLKKPESKS